MKGPLCLEERILYNRSRDSEMVLDEWCQHKRKLKLLKKLCLTFQYFYLEYMYIEFSFIRPKIVTDFITSNIHYFMLQNVVKKTKNKFYIWNTKDLKKSCLHELKKRGFLTVCVSFYWRHYERDISLDGKSQSVAHLCRKKVLGEEKKSDLWLLLILSNTFISNNIVPYVLRAYFWVTI